MRRWRRPSSRSALAVGVGDVGGAVVGHHPLDPDAAFGEPGHRAAQEADSGVGVERVEHLGVGEPGVVVDHHVHVLEAAWRRGGRRGALELAAAVADDAVAGAARADATELLDVDVDQLARPRALVAVRRARAARAASACRARSASATTTPSRAPSRAARRSRQRSSATGAAPRSPRPARCGGARRHPPRRRRAIPQADSPAAAATHPLARRHARSRRRPRPPPRATSPPRTPASDQRPALRTGPRVSVQHHPVSSLGLSGSTPSASKEARMKQRA